MIVINDNLSLHDFKAWSGAVDTQNKIIEEGKADDFDALISELYPEGLTDTALNDLLWFDDDFLYESLGIPNNED